ncbi:MAG TPA: alpha/beta hydrolase [Gemmatimonadaceae bacterium]|nr:alpha/beta hydrolase [Gemmatimonadaceae bacterium]
MNRRSFLAEGASMLGAAALPRVPRVPRVPDVAPAVSKTFVLVPGAWFGGWFFAPVATRLRALGHRVFTPTQTGVGERRHLLSREITLDTFITDVTNVMDFEDLNDVILVGHGSGATVAIGVADRMADRIRHIVFLDGLLLQGGQNLFDVLPPAVRGVREHAATERFDGVAFPPPESYDAMGVSKGPLSDWILRHATPHPLGAFESPLPITHAVGNGRPCTFVAFTSPALPEVDVSRRLAARQRTWKTVPIAAGHAAPVTVPDDVARVLADI